MTPQLQYETSEESQPDGLDFLRGPDFYDAGNMQEWKQDAFYEEPLFLPGSASNDHEKHFLSYADREESESKRQELAQDTGKKKPGRKPILNEPTTKRKAQNRAAQRAFRERKENHVKELETRVQELEQQNQSKSSENEYLKAQLAKLRGGSSDFSFASNEDFTFAFASPPTLRSMSNNSSSSPKSESATRRSDCPSLSSSHTSPQSVVEGDFNAAAMPLFARQSSYSQSVSSSNGFSASRRSTEPSSFASKASQSQPSLLFSDPYAAASAKALSFDTMSYRDNGIFDNYEADPTLFDTSNGFMDPTQLDSNLDFLLPFNDNSPDHLKEIATPPATTQLLLEEKKKAAETKRQEVDVGCDEVWQKITSHPKFPIFDLDELCTEFSKKAKCTVMQQQQTDWDTFDKVLDDFAARSERKLSV